MSKWVTGGNAAEKEGTGSGKKRVSLGAQAIVIFNLCYCTWATRVTRVPDGARAARFFAVLLMLSAAAAAATAFSRGRSSCLLCAQLFVANATPTLGLLLYGFARGERNRLRWGTLNDCRCTSPRWKVGWQTEDSWRYLREGEITVRIADGSFHYIIFARKLFYDFLLPAYVLSFRNN